MVLKWSIAASDKKPPVEVEGDGDPGDFEPDFYPDEPMGGNKSLMSMMGLDQDVQRMNVVLSPVDPDDIGAVKELSRMYISPLPRTGVLNK